MTIRQYSSYDTGGPGQVTNAAGQMIGVLDILVNGYTVGTVSSITRTGSVATITFSATHGMSTIPKGNRVTIAGADQTEYNGEHLLTITGTTTATFPVTGTPATPATGTITATKAGCGWTKPYTGTNLAAYKQGTGSNDFYLYVDDTGTSSARAVGYETMSSISDTTGNAFPTNTQVSGGMYLHKSDGATARSWIMVATETYIYLWINYSGIVTSAPITFFGDILSDKAGDIYNTLFAGNATSYMTTYYGPQGVATGLSSSCAGHYIARAASQTGTSLLVGQHINAVASKNAAAVGNIGLPYPTLKGDLKTSEIYVHETAITDIRGRLPGVLAPLHAQPLSHLDTFDGTGNYLGQVFLALSCYASGQIFIRVE